MRVQWQQYLERTSPDKSILDEARFRSRAVANDNAPGQIVISGAAAVDAAIEIAKTAGLRRVIKLLVSAPFHCDLMAPAAAIMKKRWQPLISAMRLFQFIVMSQLPQKQRPQNYRKFVAQITARVRWRESLIAMRSLPELKKFVELGTGKVLSGLVKRGIEAKAIVNLDGPDDLDSVLAQM